MATPDRWKPAPTPELGERYEEHVTRSLADGAPFEAMQRAVRRLQEARTAADALDAQRLIMEAFGPLRRTRGRYRPTRSRRDRIAGRDGGCCVVCGDAEMLVTDHLFPACFGGSNQVWNLTTLCWGCNALKGNALHVWALLLMIEQAREACR